MEELTVEIETSDCWRQPGKGLGREALAAGHQRSLYVLETTVSVVVVVVVIIIIIIIFIILITLVSLSSIYTIYHVSCYCGNVLLKVPIMELLCALH